MAGSNPEYVVHTQALTKVYSLGESDVRALDGIDMRVSPAEFVALMGASGSGKSTLLNLLGGLDRPTSGEYHLNGVSVSSLSARELAALRNRFIGFVFQSFNLLPAATALENVCLPLLYQAGQAGDVRARGTRALDQMGLAKRLDHRPNQLSGGERQRVAIARALITNPTLILADEPTGNLDSKTGKEIMKLLVGLHEQGHTIILVTHDSQVAAYAQRTEHMRDGRFIVEKNHGSH
jgi:putative ABC transport system ATP-binding protein